MQATSVKVSSRSWESKEALCLPTAKCPLSFQLIILSLLLLESSAWLLEGKGELGGEVPKRSRTAGFSNGSGGASFVTWEGTLWE